MKKICLLLCLLPMMAYAQNELRVKGNLQGLKTDTLLISIPGKGAYDTIVVKDGRFDFAIPMKEQGEVKVMENFIGSSYMRRQIALYGIPGETVTIDGSFDDYRLGGTEFYQQLNDVIALERSFKQEEKLNIAWGTAMRGDSRLNEEEITKQFHMRRNDIIQRLEDASVQYMKAHPSEEAALLLLNNIRDAHKGHNAFNSMTKEVQNGRMAGFARPYVERYDTEIARLKVSEGIQPGKMAPLFTLNDINGKPLALKSLRGKYVILDFWGSWCFWCLAGVPKMKEYYDKYQGRFEILGIDCNDTEEKWKAAVEKNKMNWLHVQCVKGGTDVPKLYAVNAYPTKILINPNGTIHRVFVGEKEEFYEYLDKLFK